MMLLMSKALNSSCTTQFLEANDYETNTGVLISQRKLAEIVEMISAAYSIHKSVLNLPYELPNETEDIKEDLQQLEYGNKIAILGKFSLCAVKMYKFIKKLIGFLRWRLPFSKCLCKPG